MIMVPTLITYDYWDRYEFIVMIYTKPYKKPYLKIIKVPRQLE